MEDIGLFEAIYSQREFWLYLAPSGARSNFL
jgi:hypothetical protein